jgi:hypothetical protein
MHTWKSRKNGAGPVTQQSSAHHTGVLMQQVGEFLDLQASLIRAVVAGSHPLTAVCSSALQDYYKALEQLRLISQLRRSFHKRKIPLSSAKAEVSAARHSCNCVDTAAPAAAAAAAALNDLLSSSDLVKFKTNRSNGSIEVNEAMGAILTKALAAQTRNSSKHK